MSEFELPDTIPVTPVVSSPEFPAVSPLSNTGPAAVSDVLQNDFAGMAVWLWIIFGLVVIAAVVLFFQFQDALYIQFFGVGEDLKKLTSDETAAVDDISAGIAPGDGYPCVLGHDENGEPVVVRVSERSMCA